MHCERETNSYLKIYVSDMSGNYTSIESGGRSDKDSDEILECEIWAPKQIKMCAYKLVLKAYLI